MGGFPRRIDLSGVRRMNVYSQVLRTLMWDTHVQKLLMGMYSPSSALADEEHFFRLITRLLRIQREAGVHFTIYTCPHHARGLLVSIEEDPSDAFLYISPKARYHDRHQCMRRAVTYDMELVCGLDTESESPSVWREEESTPLRSKTFRVYK